MVVMVGTTFSRCPDPDILPTETATTTAATTPTFSYFFPLLDDLMQKLKEWAKS
jgi:hypothetical protein